MVRAWGAGLEDLQPTERAFLRGLADDRVSAPRRKGLLPEPGQRSEIVRQADFYDLVHAVGTNLDQLDAAVRHQVEQAGARYYYLETGVTVLKDRLESIDALIFELRFDPAASVSTHAQTPDRKTAEFLTFGVDADLGLTADLQVKPLRARLRGVDVDLGAEAGAKLTGRLTTGFTLETELVDAVGRGQPWCRWLLNGGGLVKDDLRFIAVLRVGPEVPAFSITATATFIDKRIWAFELSRQSKTLAYSCTLDPPRCVAKA